VDATSGAFPVRAEPAAVGDTYGDITAGTAVTAGTAGVTLSLSS
jgi:hypothetical protein